MIAEINAECEKSDRLTVAKLNTVKQYNKQDHKSKLMTEKYLLLPLNLQQLTKRTKFNSIVYRQLYKGCQKNTRILK